MTATTIPNPTAVPFGILTETEEAVSYLRRIGCDVSVLIEMHATDKQIRDLANGIRRITQVEGVDLEKEAMKRE